MPEFYMTLLDFDPGSNYLPNGDMEADSYWEGSGDQCSYGYVESNFQYGARSFVFEIIGSAPVDPDVNSVDQSSAYTASSYGAAQLFDGITSVAEYALDNQWVVGASVTSEWFQVYFDAGKKFTHMKMMSAGNSSTLYWDRVPSQLEIVGSNVGSFQGEETTLLSRTESLNWSYQEWKTFSFNLTGTFNFYRCWCRPHADALGSWMMIAEVEFYEW